MSVNRIHCMWLCLFGPAMRSVISALGLFRQLKVDEEDNIKREISTLRNLTQRDRLTTDNRCGNSHINTVKYASFNFTYDQVFSYITKRLANIDCC